MKDRSVGKKAIHRWARVPGVSVRTFQCNRCGAGPVRIGDLQDKSSINTIAKRQGISPDCNVEIVKGVTES